MSGFTLAAAASIAAGLSIGAAAIVGVTLAVEDDDVARAQRVRTPSAPHLVEYGDRCYQGHCLPPIPQIPQLPPIPELPQIPQIPQIPLP
jgi:Protein of unknown function (DUF2613)